MKLQYKILKFVTANANTMDIPKIVLQEGMLGFKLYKKKFKVISFKEGTQLHIKLKFIPTNI